MLPESALEQALSIPSEELFNFEESFSLVFSSEETTPSAGFELSEWMGRHAAAMVTAIRARNESGVSPEIYQRLLAIASHLGPESDGWLREQWGGVSEQLWETGDARTIAFYCASVLSKEEFRRLVFEPAVDQLIKNGNADHLGLLHIQPIDRLVEWINVHAEVIQDTLTEHDFEWTEAVVRSGIRTKQLKVWLVRPGPFRLFGLRVVERLIYCDWSSRSMWRTLQGRQAYTRWPKLHKTSRVLLQLQRHPLSADERQLLDWCLRFLT